MAEYIIPSDYKGKMVAAEKLIRCKDCVSWQTPIAYTPTGKCKLDGKITNRNYYCGGGIDKDG